MTNAMDATTELLERLDRALGQLRDGLAQATAGGRAIDDHQVATRKLANLAARLAAARALADYAVANAGSDREETTVMAGCYASGVLLDARALLAMDAAAFGVPGEATAAPLAGSNGTAGGEADYRRLGGFAIDSAGRADRWTDTAGDDTAAELIDTTRRFARDVVAPHAQSVHLDDADVPEQIIAGMGEMGFFGVSVPEAYGGVGMGNLAMILATEELSAVSLGIAGSLITRPEVVTKALLAGGTEDQKRHWLPRLASGEVMSAVAVTEPDTGSDVANLKCRALPATVDGVAGYEISGNKAWCTFAGRADLLVVLARTDADPAAGHKGLSLLLVPKPRCPGRQIEISQPSGGSLTGQADRTLGYRGMHSYSLRFERFFVPLEQVVGGAAGLGRGFYYQMGGFAAGRLQTGGRAVGVARGALEAAVNYVQERRQFGRALADYQSSRYELGRMLVDIEASRQLTLRAARAMDAGASDAELLAAMAKLVACRMAVETTQRAQLLHGGWGYAEEFPVSRQVVDALVLPIFEGVEPILELKVIGRQLLRG